MRRFIGMALLALGLCIGGSFGTNLAPNHAAWITANSAPNAPDIGPPPTPVARLQAWGTASGVGWLLGCVMIVAGAVVARQATTADARATEARDGTADFVATLDRVLSELDTLIIDLAPRKMGDDAPATRDRIDALQDTQLTPLVEARHQLINRVGLARFAGPFGSFCAGERQLARCWSALTDGHIVEARAALADSRASFLDARTAWTALG